MTEGWVNIRGVDLDKLYERTADLEAAQKNAIADAVETQRQYTAKLELALREITANTYGTELINSDAENNEILGRHLVRFQKIAREALST